MAEAGGRRAVSSMAAEGFGPEEIRALRGGLSRAAFARRLGVTPLTVYRWELPASAPESRRPRGRGHEALRQLAGGSVSAIADPSPLTPEERARLSPCLAPLSRADWRSAEDGLLALLASGALHSRDARALASTGLAYLYRWGSEDARRAFTVLLPHLAEADAGLLSGSIAVHVHALAATLFSAPDGRLFDAGKVNVHVARAEALLLEPHLFASAEARCLLRLAEVSAAFYLGAPELIARLDGRVREALGEVEDPTLRMLAAEALAHEANFRGEVSLATQRFRDGAREAASVGYALLEARNLVFLAQRLLEAAVAPDEALARVRRAREVAWEGTRPRGVSFMFATRAEADALLRLGRFAEAGAALDEGDAVVEELHWTPQYLAVQRARFLYLTGRWADMRQLAARLSGYTGPLQPALTRVHGGWVEALADWAEGHARRAAEGFATTHARLMELGGWPALSRDCAVAEVGARAEAHQLPEARAALRRARALLERQPSTWSTALLHRHDGSLLAREGRPREAREKLEASLATFTLAGDLSETALTRRALAAVALAAGEPGAERVRRDADEELRRLGITPPVDAEPTPLPMPEAPPGQGLSQLGAESLLVPFERLAVRGLGPPSSSESCWRCSRGCFPGATRGWRRLDSQGGATPLLGSGEVPASEWVELGDGCGRRLRVGVAGALPADGRALLTALARMAGCALEVAVLRGFAQAEAPPHEPELPLELPGFIAASPAMRRLQGESPD